MNTQKCLFYKYGEHGIKFRLFVGLYSAFYKVNNGASLMGIKC